jgi:hypothetical protein
MRNNTSHSGAPVAGKLKARDYSKTLMLAFAVVTCIIITPPEYVKCSSIVPDESLDLFGIPEHSKLQRQAPDQAAFYIFEFSPMLLLEQCFPSESLFPQHAISGISRTPTLRC